MSRTLALVRSFSRCEVERAAAKRFAFIARTSILAFYIRKCILFARHGNNRFHERLDRIAKRALHEVRMKFYAAKKTQEGSERAFLGHDRITRTQLSCLLAEGRTFRRMPSRVSSRSISRWNMREPMMMRASAGIYRA